MREPIIKKKKPGPKKGVKTQDSGFTATERAQVKAKFLELYAKPEWPMQKIADLLGFRRQLVYRWADSDPEFAQAFGELRFNKTQQKQQTFEEFHANDEALKKEFLELYSDPDHTVASIMRTMNIVSSQLDYWTQTDFEFKKEYSRLQLLLRPVSARQIELQQVLGDTLLAQKQERFLNVFRENHFNATKACNAMGIRRAVLNEWCKKNPDFKSALDALQDEKEDFVEDALFELIDERNVAAVIFANKCLNQNSSAYRRTGYVEQPMQRTLTVEHKYDKETIDAVVRAAELSQGKMFELPQSTKKKMEAIIDIEEE